jgi:hypothetical protein
MASDASQIRSPERSRDLMRMGAPWGTILAGGQGMSQTPPAG